MNSQKRILKIFLRMLNGEVLTKKNLMADYQKDANTIQRDMRLIEDVLDEEKVDNGNFSVLGNQALDRSAKGSYAFTKSDTSLTFNDTELLATMEILLASRAFSQPEVIAMINKLTSMAGNKKLLRQLTANERLYYRGVPEDEILPHIQLIIDAIQQHAVIEFEYTKLGTTKIYRRQPNAIFFSDLYFFMLTGTHTQQDDADLETLNKFRINNIKNLRVVSTNQPTDYHQRFEGGLLRKQTVLPFLGKPITMIIDFFWDPIYVLDRFPDAKIIQQNPDHSVRIEVPVNDGYGVKMWLLGQGDMVKVISPQHIKDYIIQDMKDALAYYGLEVKEKI